MSDRDDKRGRALVPLTTPSELIDLGSGVGELAVDALLENDALREVPILKSAIGLVRAGRAIRDQLFLRKVARFLVPLEKTTAEERANFASEMDATEGGRARVGEHLVLLLERLDDLLKPEMIGRLYVAHIRGEISWRELQLLSSAVDHLFLGYWDDLADFYSFGGPKVSDAALQHLANCGLVRVDMGGFGHSASYAKNDLGQKAVTVLRAA